MVTSLRVFLRFAHGTGRTAVPLTGAVPAVASWRQAARPCGLPQGEIARLLDDCNRDTVTGLRDYVVVSLLSRLGLRGAEAAGLLLDDIDWRAGEIAVTAGSRTEPLPSRPGRRCAAGGVRDGAAPSPAADAEGGPGGHGLPFQVSGQWEPHRGHVR